MVLASLESSLEMEIGPSRNFGWSPSPSLPTRGGPPRPFRFLICGRAWIYHELVSLTTKSLDYSIWRSLDCSICGNLQCYNSWICSNESKALLTKMVEDCFSPIPETYNGLIQAYGSYGFYDDMSK
ncbi:hypothetical protein M5K25_000121 [Dendrobium thyrsiflorum]|uniref:Pentatricopeptide repeat-containing protein n=1 Tax=Dendrobium thyrsiflorum TaxID=117978 RepID=A0ABD0VUL2_DENTH